MSHAGSTVDAREFARLGQVLEGRVPVARFARLGPSLCSHDGDVIFRLRGLTDARGNQALELEIEARLTVICQRCLGELVLSLDACNRMRLVDAETAWSAEDAEFGDHEIGDVAVDEIVASPALDVMNLLEDELLLSLPVAPRHDHCELAGAGSGIPRESPFGVLAHLKKRAGK